MSKEIFLYSADNKYQAYVELADNTDRFGCPDHSFFKLIENRNDDKLYLIAEARDGLLETEKDQHIAELEQELVEKDKEIKKLNWQLKDKDFIIKNLNHSLSVAPNANAGQRARIDELTKIVKEKDKEIEKLKQQYAILENENGKLTTELIMDKYKKAQKEVSFGKQLAIQELEKVKTLIQNAINFETNFVGVYDTINNQIKELKGE